MAALALQIEYGDHNPNRHTAGFLGNIMEDYIPPHLFRLQRPEIWEADLARTHEKMVGFSELMAKTNYLRVRKPTDDRCCVHCSASVALQ